MIKKSPITRNDVAKAAGVSSATVSRVFNSPGTVVREKRDAVRQAAADLGYTPNKSASSLRRNGTGTITLLEIRKEHRPYYWGNMPNFNWFFADVIKSVNDYLETTMFTLKMETVSLDDDLSRIAAATDGILCYDADILSEAEAVRGMSIPYVLAHHTREFSGFQRCCTDNVLGGTLQGRTLQEQGCRHPLYITAYVNEVHPHRSRLDGFTRFWHEAGLDEPCVLEIPFNRFSSTELAEIIKTALMDSKADGVAAVNDIVLVSVLNSLIGETLQSGMLDLPMCGYDAVPFRSLLPYTFHSIDLNPGNLYRRAAELLIEQIVSGLRAEEELTEIIPPVQVGV